MRNDRNSLLKLLLLCVCFIVCGGLSACASHIDYSDETVFENALNYDEVVVGKIVTINVSAINLDTQFGCSIWAGDHLYFCSEERWNVHPGDELMVKVLSVAGVDDAYIIKYKMLSKVNKVEAEIQIPENNTDEYLVPDRFTDGYEKAEFEKFNSPAEMNGLGDTPICIEGVLTDVFQIGEGLEGGYSAEIDIGEDRKWVVLLDHVFTSNIERFENFKGHKVCISGIYLGYSEVLKEPAMVMNSLFDVNSGIVMESSVYGNYKNDGAL